MYDQVKAKLALGYEYLGEQAVKNITEPVRVYRLALKVPSLPVEQASSLPAARMAAPPEGQGEGAAGEAERQKAKGKRQKSSVGRASPAVIGQESL